MASIDPRFICTSDLDTYYVDNATGLPLAAGIVTFYSDLARTTLKPVYELTGSSGSYTYTALQNPIVLSIAGTIVDESGNNIVPYYYPFTGTPDQDTGKTELYYITVQNSGNVDQFTRQGWPQSASSEIPPVGDFEVDNYIPNGQFLANNTIVSITEPPVTQYTFAAETVKAQPIAQGGWYFVYTNGTASTFANSFSSIQPGGWGMNSYPRNVFNFVCKSFDNGTTTRDLRIQWPDVYKFSSGSPTGSQKFTLFFDARSNDGNTYNFTLYAMYYFGTGGSPSSGIISSPISDIQVGPSGSFVSSNIQNIQFLANPGNVGTNGDDYVALSIRGPMSGWNISVSDFALVTGSEVLTSFPIQTNDEMLSRGVAGFMPTPSANGSQLYLPLVLTPSGMQFDSSNIGKVYASFTTPESNELLCDGNSYLVSGYSSIGIPYNRLFNKWYVPSVRGSLFGSGVSFLNCYTTAVAGLLMLSQNTLGAITASPANGATSPGFSYPVSASSSTSGAPAVSGRTTVGYNARGSSNGEVNAIGTALTGPTGNTEAADVNTGMTINSYNEPFMTQYKFYISTLSQASLANPSAAGLYFTFSSGTTNYFMWFNSTNETAPSPGGTGIAVFLYAGLNSNDVSILIGAALSSRQVDYVLCTGSSAIPASSFFNFYAGSVLNTVWYQVAGVGTQPTTGATNYIMVAVGASDSATTVAQNTQAAINSVYYATPDLQGKFLRGYDPNSKLDSSNNLRFNTFESIAEPGLGSNEIDVFTDHDHSLITDGGSIGLSTVLATNPTKTVANLVLMFPTGFGETRPVNMAVNWIVKY